MPAEFAFEVEHGHRIRAQRNAFRGFDEPQMKNNATAGGKAEAAGGNYETLVAVWYANAVLLGSSAHPPFALPVDTRLVSFSCQPDSHVDDVNATTSDGGVVFVQAKRSVALSARASSAFAKSMDQFVRQAAACGKSGGDRMLARPLDPCRDRLVLATRSTCSKKVTDILPELLRRIRDRDDVRTMRQVAVTQGERAVARTVETTLKRAWKKAYGRTPSHDDVNHLFRFVWVQTLDLESGGRDRRTILEHLRTNLLEDPSKASLAFSEMFRLIARLRAERSGSDRPTLLRHLANAGVSLTVLPDFRHDVAALKRWTLARLGAAPRFTRLLADEPTSLIERTAWPAFRAAANTGSLLLVGEPGAGKSGLVYRFAASAMALNQDVVFLPVDLLEIDSFARLRAELGTMHDLSEILQSWLGSKPGLLILDALDAARRPETQKLLREVVREVLELPRSRWTVVASVRKYDLRQGMEWAAMFRGSPPDCTYADPEFRNVRHVAVGRLTSGEVAQVASALPVLTELYEQATEKLRDLLQNIFNLRLLAELLRAGVAGSDLRGITTQVELLDRYWRYRIRRDDGNHDDREAALTVIVGRMVDNQELRVRRSDIRANVDTRALVDLERNGILRADEEGTKSNEEVLLFNHHVLFDYAVARLMFAQGRDPDRFVSLLQARRDVPVMLSPSLAFALADVWARNTAREEFWRLALRIGQSSELQGVAQLAAPMIAVEQTRDIHDLAPLFEVLSASGEVKCSAETVVQNLIGALFVRQQAGVALVGPGAGPWMTFAERLAAYGSDRLMMTVHPLIARAVEAPINATPDQFAAIGSAARAFLAFAWSRAPRIEPLVTNGLTAVSKTFATDSVASVALLRQAIEPVHLAEYGYKELRWIAQEIIGISQWNPGFAVEIYEAAYGFADESDASTDIGNSALIGMRSNRRQDYEGAWFLLAAALPELLSSDIAAGMRALARGLVGYVRREQTHGADSGGQDLLSFHLGSVQATFQQDLSHIWFRGGYQPMKDAPELLKKFEAYLDGGATAPDAADRFATILETLCHEARVPAAIWVSLIVAGTRHPAVYASFLVPLVCTQPFMLSLDSRYELGCFLSAAYDHLCTRERAAIETAILGLPDDKAGTRTKAILARCFSAALVATDAFRAYRDALGQSQQELSNDPPMRFTSTVTPFDTDAYLASEGVSLEAPESATLRSLMRGAEALSAPNARPELTLSFVSGQLDDLAKLHSGLCKRFRDRVPETFYEHATGKLAEASGRLARADLAVLNDSTVRPRLEQMLLFCAQSKQPHYDPAQTTRFHSKTVSWGGPSARTSAAEGLLNMSRGGTKLSASAKRTIRQLARDRVPQVRLQIIQSLWIFHTLDPEWAWAEAEYTIRREPTRTLVAAAIGAITQLAHLDPARAIRLAKAVLRRYRNRSDPGMDHCRFDAQALIFDIHIHFHDTEASAFAASMLHDVPMHSQTLLVFVGRYSDTLVKGSIEKPEAVDNDPRRKTLAFYRTVTKTAFDEINRRTVALDPKRFSSWPDTDQQTTRAMFGILEEVAMRLRFAACTKVGGEPSDGAIEPERVRLYWESKDVLERLSDAIAAPVAHHLIQTLEAFIPVDPPGVFALIARSVRAAERGGYSAEKMAVDLVVRLVELYLADNRAVFADKARLSDLMDCLDVFVRAGWPSAQALTFRLGEIWR